MRENLNNLESQKREENPALDQLKELLLATTENEIDIEYYDGTYEIEADDFMLTFTLEEDLFEIRSIEVRGSTEGLGRSIVSAIHAFADREGCEVIASNVLDTKEGFWQKMGYREGEAGEWYRV